MSRLSRSSPQRSRCVALLLGVLLAPACGGAVPGQQAVTSPPAAEIRSFRFLALAVPAEGVIDQEKRTIRVQVPADLDVRRLLPSIGFRGAALEPAPGTWLDFSFPVRYRVLADDGTEVRYEVMLERETSALSPGNYPRYFAPQPGRIARLGAGFVVTNPTRREVWRYDDAGQVLGSFRVNGVPRGIAALGADELLVGNGTRQRLEVYSHAGALLRVFSTETLDGNDVVVEADQDLIYASDAPRHRVLVLDRSGQVQREIGAEGTAPGLFQYPTGLAVSPVTGELAVADFLNSRVQIFGADGSYRSTLSHDVDGQSLSRPMGLAFDPDGALLVSDSVRSVVYMFDAAGVFLRALGGYGSKLGQLRTPHGLLLFEPGGGRGRSGSLERPPPVLLVADVGNRRISPLALRPARAAGQK